MNDDKCDCGHLWKYHDEYGCAVISISTEKLCGCKNKK
jgi:hypothetical protein